MSDEKNNSLEKSNLSDSSLLSNINLASLTPEQKQAIAAKIVDKKLELDVEQAKVEIQRSASSVDIDKTINTVNELSSTKNDFSVSCDTNTASGKTNIKVSNHNNHATYIIIAIIGIIIIIFLLKGIV